MDIMSDLGFSGGDFSLSDPFRSGGEGASFPKGLSLVVARALRGPPSRPGSAAPTSSPRTSPSPT